MAPEFATSCKFCGAAIDPFGDERARAPGGVMGFDATAIVTAGETATATANDGTDDVGEQQDAGASPWSRAAAAQVEGAATMTTTPGPSPSAGAPTLGEPTPRPDPTPTAPSITTERVPTVPSAPPRSPAAPVTPKQPTAAARTGNRAVRIVVVGLSIAVLGVVVLIVIGQFGAGPIGKQKEAVAGRGDWVTYNDPGGAFTIQLPAEPSVSDRQTDFGAPWQSVKSRAGISTFEVSTVDYSNGMPGVYAQQWLDRQPAFMAEGTGRVVDSKRIAVQGNPGIEYAIEGNDGWFSRGAIVTIGRRAYLFEVVARADSPDGLQRMLQTFTPLPVGQK